MLKRLIASGLYGLYKFLNPVVHFQDVAILTYHSVSERDGETVVTPVEFQAQLARLKDEGHIFVSLDAILAWITKGEALPRKAVALTFDDGYEDFESTILPILEKFRAPGAVFVMEDTDASRERLGNDIPLLSRKALERLRPNRLITIGSHGRTHARLTLLKGDVLRTEMHRPEGMRYFAFAGGSYTREAIAIAKEEGYDAAFSIKPGLVTEKSESYLLQRNVILNNMSPADVHFRTTRAIEWYARISRWFK